jgi:hypothetical protein
MRSNIHNVREAVAELRAALLAPPAEGLESHVPALEGAIADLEELRAEPSFVLGLVPRREVESLARELAGVARLIQHGIIFNQGWARVLAAAASNYQPNGELAPLKPAGSVSVRG